MSSTLLLIFLMLCIGVAGWLFFLWAVKSGQYEDVEGPKYRMLDEEDEASEKNFKQGETRPDDGKSMQLQIDQKEQDGTDKPRIT